MMFRAATAADVPAITALLADDPFGAAGETAPISIYLAAFAHVAANPMHQLIVAEAQGRIVSTAQLTLLHGSVARRDAAVSERGCSCCS